MTALLHGVTGAFEALGLQVTLAAEALLFMYHVQSKFFKEPGSISCFRAIPMSPLRTISCPVETLQLRYPTFGKGC